MANKLVINTEQFKDVCGKILSAVDTSELSTITETLELRTEGKFLVVGVTNREYFVEVKLEMAEECEFHATVNASLFLKLVSQITTENIQLDITDTTLIVKGNGTYKLPLIFEGTNLLELPHIEINNVTAEFTVSADILNSILKFNSKQLTKGVITKPIQKLYFVDEQGAVTFTTGACVNSFTLPQPVKLLFNNRLVKLFKLFKEGEVDFSLGYDAISDDIVQTKVRFENGSVTLTAILTCDNTLLSQFPVTAVRGRATKDYPYCVNMNRLELIQTINRLMLFNATNNVVAKTYGIFEFGPNSVTIYDANKENCEVIGYENAAGSIAGLESYTMLMNLDDFKSTLDSCIETHVCIHFGDNSAITISRGNIKNVIPQTKLS